MCIAFCADACWLKANQSVCTHEMSLVCFVTKKGVHSDYPCNHRLPDPFVRDDPEKRKNHYSFVDSCLVSTVFRHEWSIQKEHFKNHVGTFDGAPHA